MTEITSLPYLTKKKLPYLVARVETLDKDDVVLAVGTGSYYTIENAPFLLVNKHLLCAATSNESLSRQNIQHKIRWTVTNFDSSYQALGTFVVEVVLTEVSIRWHPTVDLAGIDITSVITEEKKMGPSYFTTTPIKVEEFEKLSVLDKVVSVGFPNGYEHPYRLPIFSAGRIAVPPMQDQELLIEVDTFGGSSGSSVWLQGTKLGFDWVWLGLVYATLVYRSDSSKVSKEYFPIGEEQGFRVPSRKAIVILSFEVRQLTPKTAESDSVIVHSPLNEAALVHDFIKKAQGQHAWTQESEKLFLAMKLTWLDPRPTESTVWRGKFLRVDHQGCQTMFDRDFRLAIQLNKTSMLLAELVISRALINAALKKNRGAILGIMGQGFKASWKNLRTKYLGWYPPAPQFEFSEEEEEEEEEEVKEECAASSSVTTTSSSTSAITTSETSPDPVSPSTSDFELEAKREHEIHTRRKREEKTAPKNMKFVLMWSNIEYTPNDFNGPRPAPRDPHDPRELER